MNTSAIFPEDEPVRFLAREVPFRQITDVPEYRFNDIRTDDVVVDIDANIGAFCIRAARHSDNVTAVEPVTTLLLRENIRMNLVSVQVIEGALGDGKPLHVRWDDCDVLSPSYVLTEIISLAGGCDFLKCDCEGGEWLIQPEELAGIRRIEMELHTPPISGLPNPRLLDYISRHYHFSIDRKPCHDILGVMGVLHAVLVE